MKRTWKYLREAFLVRERVPLLGDLPVNLLVVLGFVALGFGHPAFWLLGLIGEIAFLWAMVGSKRFRNVVDALELQADTDRAQARKAELLSRLTPPNSARYRQLKRQLESVENGYREFATGDVLADENVANLRSLESVFLRLLVAKQHLGSADPEGDVARIRSRIDELEREMADAEGLTETAIESRRQTRGLLQKRLGVFDKRAQALDEIESDLEQIEAQFELAVDSVRIRAKPADAKLDMDLARVMIASSPDYLILGEDTQVHDVSGAVDVDWESE